MTAAPLAMVLHHHHQDDAVLGIQWHVLAMFGPSFFTGSLIARFGAERIVAAGLLLLVGCALVGLAGTSVAHFWLALILLGIGWNFGFIGGTTLVTATYRPEEKEKVQALNDFLIFGIVAVASFSSGEMLLFGGWGGLNIVVLPVALASLAALFWQMRRRSRAAYRPAGSLDGRKGVSSIPRTTRFRPVSGGEAMRPPLRSHRLSQGKF